MTNAEKQLQSDSYKTTLDGIVLKIQQNELDAGNNVEMTTPPYVVRQEITLLRRQISIFNAAELPILTRKQQDAKPALIGDPYKLADSPILRGDGQTLTIMKWDLEDVLNATIERFNQHLINLRPGYYPNRPQPINA